MGDSSAGIPEAARQAIAAFQAPLSHPQGVPFYPDTALAAIDEMGGNFGQQSTIRLQADESGFHSLGAATDLFSVNRSGSPDEPRRCIRLRRAEFSGTGRVGPAVLYLDVPYQMQSDDAVVALDFSLQYPQGSWNWPGCASPIPARDMSTLSLVLTGADGQVLACGDGAPVRVLQYCWYLWQYAYRPESALPPGSWDSVTILAPLHDVLAAHTGHEPLGLQLRLESRNTDADIWVEPLQVRVFRRETRTVPINLTSASGHGVGAFGRFTPEEGGQVLSEILSMMPLEQRSDFLRQLARGEVAGIPADFQRTFVQLHPEKLVFHWVSREPGAEGSTSGRPEAADEERS